MTLQEPRPLPITHPETEFFLPSYPTHVGGHYKGEPTGAVVCVACWESHLHYKRIDHEDTCPQRYVE